MLLAYFGLFSCSQIEFKLCFDQLIWSFNINILIQSGSGHPEEVEQEDSQEEQVNYVWYGKRELDIIFKLLKANIQILFFKVSHLLSFFI